MSREEEIRQELFDHTLNGHAPEVKALTQEGLQLLASVLERTSGAGEDPELAKDIEHDVVNAMAVEVLRVHTALRRRT